jgi:hypothetical protein
MGFDRLDHVVPDKQVIDAVRVMSAFPARLRVSLHLHQPSRHAHIVRAPLKTVADRVFVRSPSPYLNCTLRVIL